MSLEIQKDLTVKDVKSVILLNKYLSGTVAKMNGQTKSEAEKTAQKDAEKAAGEGGIKVTDVIRQEAEVNKDLKKFGLREKLNYATDAKALKEDSGKAISTMINTAVLSTATVLTLAVAASSRPEEGAALGVVAGGLMGAVTVERLGKAVLRAVAAPKNEEQAKKVADYTELKHTQLALKQLKNILLAPEKEAQKAKDKELIQACYAGMGISGYVMPVTLAKQNKGR